MNILEKIVSAKKLYNAFRKPSFPISKLSEMPGYSRQVLSLKSSLKDSSKNGIIAEFKRRSPSKGVLNAHADLPSVVKAYSDAGVSGISVLTESEFFSGSEADLQLARENVQIPLLRKDFMIDSWQIHEARALGADVILLIAAILTRSEIQEFTQTAQELGMEVLLEIHSAKEFEASFIPQVDLLGINNRNLDDFSVDLNTSFETGKLVPAGMLKISESAISEPAVIQRLRQGGFNGFLIGERFMAEPDPGRAMKDFARSLSNMPGTEI